MANARKSISRDMDKAAQRAAGIKAVDSKMDFGNGLTLAAYEAAIADATAALNEYNSTLAVADEKLNDYNAKENAVKELSARMLSAVEARFGRDSSEYEKADGTRASERARRTTKTVVSNDAAKKP